MEYNEKQWGRVICTAVDTKQEDLEKVSALHQIVYGYLHEIAAFLNDYITQGKNKAKLLNKETIAMGDKQVMTLLYEHGAGLKIHKLHVLLVGYKNTVQVQAVDNKEKNSILPRVEEALNNYRI